ncbi:HlyD family type I secretion periplasmic adaptor subunit [Nisaea sp.]|uniref:HlyD family type I secretion periplasmic adaptor subunit n=1 Tax=Nisaea sp. TaxID=2024842 RepID=UPI003B51F43F
MSETLPATLDNPIFSKRLPIAKREASSATTDENLLSQAPWRKSALFGWGMLFLFFILFGGWSVVAPLASAVRAPGKLQVVSEAQVVQHFEGGIVKEILVQEGQRVQKGDVLLRLDPLTTDAQFAQLENKLFSLLAEKARLEAERDGLSSIEFPERLLSRSDDPEIADLIRREESVFSKQRTATNDQKQLISERIAQYITQIDGANERLVSTRKQIEIVEEELAGVMTLYDKGLERKPRVLALERAKEQLKGLAAQLETTVAQYRQSINEQELRRSALENEHQSQISARLRNNALQLADIREQESIWKDRRERIQIRAPRSGQVIDLKTHTVDGVVRSGEPLMTIIPTEDELIVTAKVKPKDIDAILIGAPVQLQLAAFNPRITPPIEGTLTSVSLDSVPNSGRGGEFFEARIAIDPVSLKTNIPNAQLSAGMTVSALISVGERTLFEYVVTPLSASLSQAMREP